MAKKWRYPIVQLYDVEDSKSYTEPSNDLGLSCASEDADREA